MKTLSRLIRPRLVAGLTLAVTLLNAHADQLVVENFGQAVADNSPIGLATGWYAIAIAGGTLNDYTTATPNGNYPTMSRAANGGQGGVTGCAVMGAFSFATPSFFWTNTTDSLHDATITNIVFYTKNNANTSTERVVVQVGEQWYAATNVFRDNGGNNVWFTNTFTFTRAATSWQLFDTNTLTFGAERTEPLPDADILAVGIYGAMPVTGKIRLDSVSVNGIPAGVPAAGAPVIAPAASVTAPTAVTITVPVNGRGPIGYQWRKDGVEIADGASGSGSTRNGALTSQLTISTTGPGDSGQYDLVVTNNYGAVTSAVAVVTVNQATIPPSITSVTVDPVSRTNEVGTTPMSITVAAEGTGPLHYQWQKNGADIDAQTGTTLTLASAFTNAGTYTVVITNVAAAITSAPVVLAVVDTTAPTITFTRGLNDATALNTPYTPIYVTADNSGEAVTVEFTGTVNSSALGTYSLNYFASDASGNTNSGTLTVNVLLIAERFNESTIDNGIVSQAPGWHALGTAVASGIVTDYTTTPNPPINANYPTLSQNAGTAGALGGPGYLVMGDVATVNPSFIWKDTTVVLQDHRLTNITFYSKNNDAGNLVYLVIRVGTNWYASTTTFTDTTANASWAPQSFAFTTDAAAWQLFDASTLTIIAPLSEPLPNLSVTAVGFFGQMLIGKIRLDELQAGGTPAVYPPTSPQVSQPVASPLNPVDGTAWTALPLTFTATTTGTQPITYQWRFNGGNIASATQAQYVLSSPTPLNSGNYDVIVSNAGGSVTSAVVAVTVSGASILATEHFNQSTNDPGVVSQAPGWHALALDLTNSVVTDYTSLPNPPLNGNFPNLSLSAGSDGSGGYLVAGQGDAVNPVLLWLDTTTLLQNTAPTNVTFFTRNNFPSSTMQVAVRLNNQWYVSTTQLFDNTLNAGPWTPQTFTFAPDAGAWQALDPATLVLGDLNQSSLNFSNATAVGIYCNMAIGRIRIDEFRLSGIAVAAPPAPQPTIQPVFTDGSGNLVLRTVTAVGRNYVLESTPSLTAPITWTPMTTNAGNGGVITNVVPANVPNTRAFFRYNVQ